MVLTVGRAPHLTVTTQVTTDTLSTMEETDTPPHLQGHHKDPPKGNITIISPMESPLPGRVRTKGTTKGTITHPEGGRQVTPLTFPIENTEDLPLNCTKNLGIHSHPTKMCQDR